MKTKTIIRITGICVLVLAVFACASGGGARGLAVEGDDLSVFIQKGHTTRIRSAVFSPDEQRIVSTDEQSIIIWETSSGREIHNIAGHLERINSVAFSHNGRYVVSTSRDKTAKIWDAENGELIKTFQHEDEVAVAVFDLEDKYIYSTTPESMVIWNIASGERVRNIPNHQVIIHNSYHHVTITCYSNDRNFFLTNGWNNTINLWSIETGRVIHSFSGHSGLINSFAFSPDGKRIISSDNSTVRVWDVNTGNELHLINAERILSTAISPDGKHIITHNYRKILQLREIETGTVIRSRFLRDDSGSGSENTAYFSQNGKNILAAGTRGIYLIDTQTMQITQSYKKYSIGIKKVLFSPDGRYILAQKYRDAIISDSTHLVLWDTVTGRNFAIFGGGGYENYQDSANVLFSPDGKHILSTGFNGMKLWNFETLNVTRFFINDHWNNFAVFSPDGKYIVTAKQRYPGPEGSAQDSMSVWDTATGRVIRYIENYGTTLSFSPDGKLAVSSDGIIWEFETGKEIRKLQGNISDNRVTLSKPRFIFSPDGRYILGLPTRSLNNFTLYNAHTGDEIYNLLHSYLISPRSTRVIDEFAMAFSSDGKHIVTGSSNFDYSIKVWDVETGHEIQTFVGHEDKVLSVSFSPDGKQIVSGSLDGTVRLWEIASGKEIVQFISIFGSDTQLAAASRGLTVETQAASSNIEGEWLAITPDGYFNASPRGDRFINVRVGNTVSGIDAFRSIFYNPDVVEARLQGRPDPTSRANVTIQQVASFTPPTVTIQSPANFSTTNTATTNLTVNITDQNQPLQNIRVFINGRPAGRSELATVRGNGLQAERTSLTVTGNQRTVNFTMPLELDPGNNRIEVVAFNGMSENRRHIDVTWNAPAGQRPALPNLWILAVGVNNYDNAGERLGGMGNLRFCAADARSMVALLKAQEGRRYAQVNSLLIADGEAITPTTANIRQNLAFLDQAGDRDVVLLFLAGHGASAQEGRFFFLPRDAVVSGSVGSWRVDESRAISGDEITAILEGPGNRLLFIDACNSGGVDNNRMIRGLMESNAFVFAASQGHELSYEDARWGGGHGVFTYSILNALRGAPAALAEGNVSVRSMSGFVSLEVPRQTGNRQNPRVHSLLFADFPMAVIR